MAIKFHLLKETDNLAMAGEFEPHTHTISLIIEECGTTTLGSATAVRSLLSDATRAADYAAEEGSEFLYWDGAQWAPFLRDTEFGSWRIRNIKIDSLRDKANAWRVTITQTNMGKMDNDSDPLIAVGTIQCTTNSVARTRQVNAWRVGSLSGPTERAGTVFDAGGTNGQGKIFSNCPADWSLCHTGQDVGGSRIDINGGNPTQFNVGQEQITLEFVSRQPWLNWNTEESYPKWAELYYLRNLINTRNAEMWFGYSPGFLLVSDVAVQPLHHEFKRVSVTLLYDKWKHANQRPWVTKSGVVSGTDTCEGVTPPVNESLLVNLTAEQVWWLQPFQQLGSLGTAPEDLFPVGAWEQFWYQLDGTNGSSYAAKAAADGCA